MSAPAASGTRRSLRMRGFYYAESTMAMAVALALTALGLAGTSPGRPGLSVVQAEAHGALHQAFSLARARGRNVVVALGDPPAPGILTLGLPHRIAWGKPASIPAPPGMHAPKVAGSSGMAHPRITVTPRHTATASAWFLNDGQGALCLRVSGLGHIQILRWCGEPRAWSLR